MSWRTIRWSLGLAAALLGFSAGPAAAAPSLDIGLTRDEANVSRSDERVDYAVEIENVSATPPALPHSAAAVGETLLCAGAKPPKNWLPAVLNAPDQFSFEWRRNGAVIPGQSAVSYVATAADAGQAIQCLVTGANANAAATFASLPAVVVDPEPAVEPPRAADPKVDGSRPTIAGSGTAQRTCAPPANWLPSAPDPNAPSYAFQWLRNGVPIAAATASTYTPGAEDNGKLLQCLVTGSNTGGSVVGISATSAVGSVPSPPNLTAANTPEIVVDPTTVVVELPLGSETRAYEAGGGNWTCVRQPSPGAGLPATATCRSFAVQAPGGSYETLVVAVELGADAPDLALTRATVSGGGVPAPESSEDQFSFEPPRPFGFTAFETMVPDKNGIEETRAGAHPFLAKATFSFPRYRKLAPNNVAGKYGAIEHARTLATDTPRGFAGNALAVPELCSGLDAVIEKPSGCPADSLVGGITIQVTDFGPFQDFPIYSVEPEFGVPAQFAFAIPATDPPTTYTFVPRLRADDGYAITLESAAAPVNPELLDLPNVTLCGYGAKTRVEGGETKFDGCREPGEPGANTVPLITLPTRCAAQPPTTVARVDSWEHPGDFKSRAFSAPPVTACDAVRFEPEMELRPASRQADSPTGLDVELTMPTEGLEGKDDEGNPDPDAIAQANMKRATVTFPVGMAINASAGHGLGGCAADQVKLGTNEPISCPDASKVGSIAIETPLIRERLTGSVYVAKQGEVDGALLGLYMVFDSRKDGILVKLPGKVTPDPVTGQLVVSVDDSPEAPFSSVELHFAQGPRAVLLNPPRCGTYEIEAELAPWTAANPDDPGPGEIVTQTSTFVVDQGPNGGPCPSGGLAPRLEAGATSPVAGATSPFVMRLSREDGSQRFSALNLHTPPGLTAYLRGVPYCPDAVLASISSAAGTGATQIANPSCPADSRVGTVLAGAGAGPDPFYVDTGAAYLAGPYKGAPLSIAVVAPAVAGPLDLGTVVVRNALHLDPETAQVSVVSDPIPTILHGILLGIRDIRVAIDRPAFTLNPTNCEPMSVGVEVAGADGGRASLSNRFQVDRCGALAFKPKVHLRLFGGTRRGAHPSLRGVVTAAAGEANIGRAAVTIPRSEFLDQAHIRTICTRVQFAARACPKGSIYGHARAITPLLDYPVEGPVYMRSSDNTLPDLVAVLRGPAHQPIEAHLVGRVDSRQGQIRTTFESPPDVPVSRFVLSMRGGRKGLLVNSRDICARRFRATVRMQGQNGKRAASRPLMRNRRCAGQGPQRRD